MNCNIMRVQLRSGFSEMEVRMKDLLIPFVAATIICIAIFWGSRKIECKSILMLWWIGIFLISLVMENWHFLLVYLPQRSEYRQTTAVVYWEHLGSGYSRIRHKKAVLMSVLRQMKLCSTEKAFLTRSMSMKEIRFRLRIGNITAKFWMFPAVP